MRKVLTEAFNEVYDLLSEHNEQPKMTRDVFLWWQDNEYLYRYKIELRTLILNFEKPFNCQLFRNNVEQDLSNEQIISLREKLHSLFKKINKLSMFL